MCYLETIIVLVILGPQSMIKKGTDKHINQIPESPSQYDTQTFAL